MVEFLKGPIKAEPFRSALKSSGFDPDNDRNLGGALFDTPFGIGSSFFGFCSGIEEQLDKVCPFVGGADSVVAFATRKDQPGKLALIKTYSRIPWKFGIDRAKVDIKGLLIEYFKLMHESRSLLLENSNPLNHTVVFEEKEVPVEYEILDPGELVCVQKKTWKNDDHNVSNVNLYDERINMELAQCYEETFGVILDSPAAGENFDEIPDENSFDARAKGLILELHNYIKSKASQEPSCLGWATYNWKYQIQKEGDEVVKIKIIITDLANNIYDTVKSMKNSNVRPENFGEKI